MKRILLLIVINIGVFTALVGREDYDRLWKNVQQAIARDMPATARQTLRTIETQALDEGNDAQLLRAMFTAVTLAETVSADSVAPVWEAIQARVASESRPVELALWHCALGHSARCADSATSSADSEGEREQHLRLAVSDFDALAQARASQYLPLFEKGDDSKAFGDDLLHIVGYAVADCLDNAPDIDNSSSKADSLRLRLATYYAQHGPRSAALMSALRTTDQRGANTAMRLARLDSLAALYADLPQCVEVYNAMIALDDETQDPAFVARLEAAARRYATTPRVAVIKDYLTRISSPHITLSPIGTPSDKYAPMPVVVQPGDTLRFVVKRNNVETYSLRLVPLQGTTHTLRQIESGNIDRCKPSGKSIVTTYRYPAASAPYITTCDTISIAVPQAGIYRATLIARGLRNHSEAIPLYVSPHKAVLLQIPGQGQRNTHLVVVDAHTGHPIEGATVQAFEVDEEASLTTPSRTFSTDAEGRAHISLSEMSGRSYNLALIHQGHVTHPLVRIHNTGWYGTQQARNGSETEPKRARLEVRLFVDRGIYRPGQVVHFGGIAYTKRGDETLVAEKSLDIILRDANHREIDRITVRSDATGTFGGTFTLPEHCLTGTFSISCGNPAVTEYFGVETYKRPTFSVNIEAPEVGFALGDSVRVEGTARTYSDQPVPGARVQYKVVQRYRGGARYQGVYRGAAPLLVGETVTDAEGHFGIIVPLPAADADSDAHNAWWRHVFGIEVTVTSSGGESAEATHTLYASQRPSVLTITCPSTICRQSLTTQSAIVINHTNAAGKSVGGGGRYTLRRIGRTSLERGDETTHLGEVVSEGDFAAGKALSAAELCTLPSGKYQICATVADSAVESVKAEFVLLGEDDRRLAFATRHFEHVSPNAAGDSVSVWLGTSYKDTYIYYDLAAESGYDTHRTFVISDSIVHEMLVWRPEYGDGATAVYAFVRDGALYTTQIAVQRPRPDKRLEMRWETFRNRLEPGQTEEWRLSVRHPDGSPAEAVVIARLYDASLDALRQYKWHFDHYFERRQPSLSWTQPSYFNPSLVIAPPYRSIASPGLSFTHWRPELFTSTRGFVASGLDGSVKRRVGLHTLAAPMLYAKGATEETATLNAVNDAAMLQTDGIAEAAEGTDADTAPTLSDSHGLRRDFAETTFFDTTLRTDAAGICTIAFTLPQSLTQWHFSALAHDHEMRYGLIDADIVARRLLMAEAKLPRFVRTGDKVSLPVTVTRCADPEAAPLESAAQTAEPITLTLVIADARTGHTLRTYSHKMSLAVGESQTADFGLEAPAEAGALTVMVRATSAQYSDGEMHTLAVLSDDVAVQRAIPFSLAAGSSTDIKLDNLWPKGDTSRQRLTIEATSRPIWTVIAALPALIKTAAQASDDWATRLYCVTVAEHLRDKLPEGWLDALANDTTTSEWAEILHRNPDLKAVLLEDSPWAVQAEAEAERVRSLRTLMSADYINAQRWSAIDNLRAMQTPSGAWQWLPGMGESRSATTEVLTLLMRMQMLCPEAHYDAVSQMTARAMAYLDKCIADDVREARRHEREHHVHYTPGEAQIRYLYLWSMLHDDHAAPAMSDEVRYLIDRARSADPKTLTMYGKSLMAVIFAATGETATALDHAQSLVEHTVSDATMGRYFDTQRAFGGWASYRMPTQVGVIEALQRLETPTLKYADGTLSRQTVIDELRQWLLQSRRTQIWETSHQTTDAIYALLSAGGTTTATQTRMPSLTLRYRGGRTYPVEGQQAGIQTAGYQRAVITAAADLAPKSLSVDVGEGGMVWGAVFAEGHTAANRAEATGSGMTLSRHLEVWRGGRWQELGQTTPLRVGDRVRQVLKLRTARDYDFVCLDFGQSASLQPAVVLSGRRANGGVWCYSAPGETGTKCFVEHLAKGEYTFSDESFAAYPGTTLLPPARVQCVYAPEFGAMTGAARLVVGK